MKTMNIDIGQIINNVSKVTLKGGVFAKTCTVLIILIVCFTIIAYNSTNIWIIGSIIGGIFTITFTMLLKLITFANNNPQAALLEGAEFLIHEQLKLAAKGVKNLDGGSLNTDNPIKIDNSIEMDSNKPDERGEEVDNA